MLFYAEISRFKTTFVGVKEVPRAFSFLLWNKIENRQFAQYVLRNRLLNL